MRRAINHITISDGLNTEYSYLENCNRFYNAIDMLCSQTELGQYPALVLLDALVCVDVSKLEGNGASIIADAARKILDYNRYHPQSKVLTFAASALYKYAAASNKTLREAYKDFLVYDLFDSILYHYVVLHTQPLSYVASSMQKRAKVRAEVQEKYQLDTDFPYINDLVGSMPDIKGYDPSVRSGFKRAANNLENEYGETLSIEIACLVVIKATIEDISIGNALSSIPQDIAEDKVHLLRKAFDAFAIAHERDPLNSLVWMGDAMSSGMYSLMLYADSEEKTAAIIAAIDADNELRNNMQPEQEEKS